MFNTSKYLLALATLVSGVLATSPAAADSPPMTGHQGQQHGNQQVNSGGSRHGGSWSGQRNDRGSHDNPGDGRNDGGRNGRGYGNDRGHDGRGYGYNRGYAGYGNPGYGGWGQRAVYGLPAYRGWGYGVIAAPIVVVVPAYSGWGYGGYAGNRGYGYRGYTGNGGYSRFRRD